MNILVIKNIKEYFLIEEVVFPVLEKYADAIVYEDRTDVFNEEYMLKISGIISENRVSVIFSVGFIEQYSLLCGVMNMRYVCWETGNYGGSAYSYAVCNEWNTIYTTSRNLLDFLIDKGCKSVHLLPLCYNSQTVANENGGQTESVLFWTDGVFSGASVNEVMNSLKDSTKGYIDATLLGCRAHISLESIARSLPEYVLKDLKENVDFTKSSLLEFEDYCDKSFFYPMIDRMISYQYFHMLMSNKIVDKVSFAMERELPYTNKELIRVDRSEVIASDYTELDKYKVIAYFTEFGDDGSISQDLWNIMGKGIFVLCSDNIDLSILGDDAPETFKNIWEFERKMRFYLDNDEERKRKATIVSRKVLELGTYEDRVKKICDDLRVISD